MFLDKSLICNNHRARPSTDPCGTAEVTAYEEEHTLLITTFCCRLFR